MCGSAAVPALGEHRYHQFPQRARDVTLADLGNTPAGADLVDCLSGSARYGAGTSR